MIGQGRGQVVTRFCTSAGRYSTGQISKHLIFHRYAAPRKKKGWNGMGGKNFPVNVRKRFASCLPVPYNACTANGVGFAADVGPLFLSALRVPSGYATRIGGVD